MTKRKKGKRERKRGDAKKEKKKGRFYLKKKKKTLSSGEDVITSRMKKSFKLMVYIFVVVPKLFIAVLLVSFGGRFLMNSLTKIELILNIVVKLLV